MPLKRASHCVYDLHYHIVFTVKYRKALIDSGVEDALARISDEIAERYAIEFEALGADRNHIHILCSAHPKIGVGQIVRIFKSITARQLFLLFPGLRKDLWGGEFWSDGYYAATVGERGGWNVVLRYVENQGDRPEPANLRQLRLWPGNE
jgi:putative transposase